MSESCRAFSLHGIFLLNLCVGMSKATLLLVSFRVSPVCGPICCIIEFMLELKWVKTVYGLKFPPRHAMASGVAACCRWLLRFVYHGLTPAFFLGGEASESCWAFILHSVVLFNICVRMSKAMLFLVSFRVLHVCGLTCGMIEFMLALR